MTPRANDARGRKHAGRLALPGSPPSELPSAATPTVPGTTSTQLSQQLDRRTGSAQRGWAAYFRYAAAKRTFAYLGYYAWRRVVGWLRKKHPQWTWKQIRRRYFGKDQLQERGIVLYNPASMRVERYRYRGAQITTPWNEAIVDPNGARHRRTSHDDHEHLGRLQQALA